MLSIVVQGWHLPALLLIERGWHLLAPSPAHGFFNSSARITPTSTFIDRARVPATSFIDKARMIPASFTDIDYEKWLLIRVFQGQSIWGFFQMRSADKVTSGVGLFSNVSCISSLDCISSVGLRMVAFWSKFNLWYWNCSDEIVCHIRWPGHVTTLLQLPLL